jgi:hypothetical protein
MFQSLKFRKLEQMFCLVLTLPNYNNIQFKERFLCLQAEKIHGRMIKTMWFWQAMKVSIQTHYLIKELEQKKEDHVGHIMKETSDKIVIFGEGNNRLDIPKSEIYQVGMNLILKIDFPEMFKCKVSKDSLLPNR